MAETTGLVHQISDIEITEGGVLKHRAVLVLRLLQGKQVELALFASALGLSDIASHHHRRAVVGIEHRLGCR